MAHSHMKVQVEIRDLKHYKLYVWEMQQLIDELRVGANPLAGRLESMLARFTSPLSDDELAEVPDPPGSSPSEQI